MNDLLTYFLINLDSRRLKLPWNNLLPTYPTYPKREEQEEGTYFSNFPHNLETSTLELLREYTIPN